MLPFRRYGVLTGVFILFFLATACMHSDDDDDDDNESVVTTITVTPATASIAVDGTQQYSAVVLDQNDDEMSGVSIAWDSSEESVATISGSGLATGVAAGTTQITASAGGVDSTPVTLTVTSESMTGTAAVGAPIVAATVTLVDAAGVTSEAVTDDDGNYSIPIDGLMPPFLVRVALGGGASLYSVSAEDVPTVVNIHPFTDLIIRAWYEVQGTDVETAFASPAGNPPPEPGQVELIANVVATSLNLWLEANGVDPAEFNLITTPFNADSTGFDALLDNTVADGATGAVLITDGTTTQDSTFAFDDANDTVTVTSTTTGPAGTTTSVNGTVVPSDDLASAALDGIQASLAALMTAVNSNGVALTATDVVPFIADGALFEGLDADLFAANIAGELRGLTLETMTVESLGSLDTGTGTAIARVAISGTVEDVAVTDTIDFHFKNESGTWRLFGDQSLASVSVHSEMRVDQGAAGTTATQGVNVDVRPLIDTVSAVVIDGGGLFSATTVPSSGTTEIEELSPTPETTVEVQRDTHFLTVYPAQPPAPGTVFTLTLTPLAGENNIVTRTTGATTTDQATVTSPTGHALADANLGASLDVQWSRPSTFSVVETNLSGFVFTAQPGQGGFQCSGSESELAADATGGTITLPSTCSGEAVVAANLNVSFNGANGERINIIYSFGQ